MESTVVEEPPSAYLRHCGGIFDAIQGDPTILDLLFNWQDALNFGMDVVAYLIMALVGTIFFILRLAIALFFGGDSGDLDGDLGDVGDGDSAFSMFSVLSILAFFMGAGWMGLTCRLDWQLGSMVSALAATGFGSVLMIMASALMAFTRKLNQVVEYDLETAVGHTASVYMTIPKRGAGRGKIQVAVSGRMKTLDAISDGPAISEFKSVKVLSVRDDGTFVVEPQD
jgi:hypothetical protein